MSMEIEVIFFSFALAYCPRSSDFRVHVKNLVLF